MRGAAHIMSHGSGKFDEAKHPRNHGKFSHSPGAGAAPAAPAGRSLPHIPAPGERRLPSIPAIPAHLRPGTGVGARPAAPAAAPFKVPDIPRQQTTAAPAPVAEKPKTKPPKPRAARTKKPSADTAAPAPTAAKPAAPQHASLVGVDDKTFAAAVQDAADRAPLEHGFGPNKVFAHHLHEALKPRLGDMSLDDFKRKLVRANRDQHVNLSRADLVGAMNPKQVASAEINDKGATFHFVGRKNPTISGASSGPVAPDLPPAPAPNPPKPRAARTKKPSARQPKASPAARPAVPAVHAPDARPESVPGLRNFAARVQAVADRVPKEHGVGDGAYIHRVYEQMKPELEGLSLDQFKQLAVAANRDEHLRLNRMDLVDDLHPDDIESSTIYEVNHDDSALPPRAAHNVIVRSEGTPRLSGRPHPQVAALQAAHAPAPKPRTSRAKKPPARKPPKPRASRARSKKS